jgi:hypothetical protein
MQQNSMVDMQSLRTIIEYPITDIAIDKLSKRYAQLEITDAKSYKDVTIAIGEVRKYRIAVEKKRKKLKKESLEYGRKVDKEAKRITAMLVPIESGLKEKKQIVDDQKAAEKAEKARIEAARVETIRVKIADIQKIATELYGLGSSQIMDILVKTETVEILPDEYEEFTLEAKQVHAESVDLIKRVLETQIQHETEEAERKAEAERLEKIRIEQEVERKRLEEIAAANEAKKQAEQNRIDKENAKLEVARAAIEKERQIIEAEKQVEADLKKQETLKKRLAEEAKIKAERDAREKADREEAERVAKEEAEAAEKKRQEAMKPDKEKLVDFANRLCQIDPPKVVSYPARQMSLKAVERLHEIASWMIKDVEKL